MQFPLLFQILYGDQLFAVQRADEGQTGINAAIAQPIAFRLGQHHGTSAAIAGGTALFGAAAAKVTPQVVQHRGVGIECGFCFQGLIKQKLDHAASWHLAARYTTLPST